MLNWLLTEILRFNSKRNFMVIKHFLVYFIKKDHCPASCPSSTLGNYIVLPMVLFSLHLTSILQNFLFQSGLTAALLWKRQYFSTKSKHSCLFKFTKSFKTKWDKKSSVYKYN